MRHSLVSTKALNMNVKKAGGIGLSTALLKTTASMKCVALHAVPRSVRALLLHLKKVSSLRAQSDQT